MKIIEFYGYSGSGKSFDAKKLKDNFKYNDLFIKISRKNRFKRFILKIFFLRFIKLKDFLFILKVHKRFVFEKNNNKYKNLLSLMYLISYIRSYNNTYKTILIDHGIFQCLFSCFLYSKTIPRIDNLSRTINIYFTDLKLNFESYKIIEKKIDIEILKKRLELDNNHKNLNFLKYNKNKVQETYINLNEIKKYINNKSVIFEDDNYLVAKEGFEPPTQGL